MESFKMNCRNYPKVNYYLLRIHTSHSRTSKKGIEIPYKGQGIRIDPLDSVKLLIPHTGVTCNYDKLELTHQILLELFSRGRLVL